MKVDAPGLVAAAQRLLDAVIAVGGAEVPHPPLAADVASVGTAARLSAAGGELGAGLAAHVAALIGTVEALTGTAAAFVAMDEFNKALLALTGGRASGLPVSGVWAPPAPPVPPDVRLPMPPPMTGPPEAISAAAHAGDPSAGEIFTSAWSQLAASAHDGADTIRATVGALPESLDAEVSTPAVSAHLLAFADGLDTYAERARTLVTQASAYAENQVAARQAIPSPEQLATADQNVRIMQANNIASGGKYAAPLAQAVATKTQLNNQTVTGYSDYHANTDAATSASDPGDPGGASGAGGAAGEGVGGSGKDPASAGSADQSGQMAGQMAQMIPTVLGAVGGVAGGLLGAVTKAPEALMQAASQAAQQATQAMKGVGEPKLNAAGEVPHMPEMSDGAGGSGGGAGGGGAGVSPAGGAGPLSVAPTTGAPSTPAVEPAGASGPPSALGPAGGGVSGMPMGMPMGGMGGLGGVGGQGGGDKSEAGRPKKIAGRDIPHTEDVTGRVDTNRLAAAAAATRGRSSDGPDDDDPPGKAEQVVRQRIVTRPPEEPT
ncbi:PPE family protein (plasmid) [Mycobacterium sp. JS623]|uniref:PPE domain-containing protein n=1 Tax=Mycobacterium sp. JS623 TaxID=212767 RepID=UPI0002A573BE|nr:PPE domain-containing protein [Mycobacterium sp. JS623]AGB26866.1 PPE family protein [Mycobacterium sp. JS623]